jgi:hypothetical protein
MSDLARRMSAATDLFEAARRLFVNDPYDVAQTTAAREIELLTTRLATAAERAEGR